MIGNAAIDIIMKLQDDASAGVQQALRQMEGNASSASVAMGGLQSAVIAVGTAIAAYITFDTFRQLVSSAEQAEAAARRVEAVVAATGGAAGYSAEQITDYASELQRLTNVDDEVIAGAQAIILTFKNIKGDVFDQTTEAALNMAAVLQSDPKTAALQLAKALNDPAEGLDKLTRSGVSFTAGQKAQIKAMQETGDLYGAQKLMLAELESEFGRVARAGREGFGGALGAVNIQLGEMEEALGGFVVNSPATTAALNGIADELYDLNTALKDGETASSQYVNSLVGVGAVALTVAGSVAWSWNELQKIFDFTAMGVAKISGAAVRGLSNLETKITGRVSDLANLASGLEAVGDAAEQNLILNDQDQDKWAGNLRKIWEAYDRITNKVNDASRAAAEFVGPPEPKRVPSPLDTDSGESLKAEKKTAEQRVKLDRARAEEISQVDIQLWRDREDRAAKSAKYIADLKLRVELAAIQEITRVDTEMYEAQTERAKKAAEDSAALRRRVELSAAEEISRVDRELYEAQLERAAEVEAFRKKTVEEIGGLSDSYQQRELNALDERLLALKSAGESELTIARYKASEIERIESEMYYSRWAAADNYYSALDARLQMWAESNAVTVQSVSESFVSGMDTAITSVSDTLGQAIVYQQNLASALEATLKSLLAQFIGYLARSAIQYVISSAIQMKAAATRTAAEVAGYAAETYAAAFASTVGFLTPVGAASYADAATATMLAGASASYTMGMGAMQGLAGIGQADQGMIVPRTGSYLMNLEAGEVFIPRSAGGTLETMENGLPGISGREDSIPRDGFSRTILQREMISMRETAEKGAARSGPTSLTINVTLPNGEALGKFFVDLARDGDLRSGNYAIVAEKVA